MGPVQSAMRSKLEAAFAPTLLDIRDDSAQHAHHAGARAHATKQGSGAASVGETHFTITIHAPAFATMTRVARQRAVYAVLAEELAGPVHALALKVEG
jgi:BolA family transcriptional regulator, general stress-responsive regulator